MDVKIIFLALTISTCSCTLSLDDLTEEEDYTDFSQSEPTGHEELIRARVDLKVGQIEVEPGSPANCYELDMHYRERALEPRVDFGREGDVANLSIGLDGESKSFRGLGDNNLYLRLNPDTPLELETSTGVGECHIDLTGMKVRSLVLESGLGETKVTMLESNPISCEKVRISSGAGKLELVGLGNLSFDEFKFQGGIGAASLDFSGDWETVGEIEIEVGVGGVKLQLPRDIGAEVRVSKSFLFDIQLPRFKKQGDTYYSDNIERVSTVIKFRVNAGIGEVELEWI